MQTGNTDFIYRNGLDKAFFQHDMAYGKSKHLAKRTQADKIFRDKAFKISNDPKRDGYQRGLASMIYKFFGKKSSVSGVATSLANIFATELNYQLANEYNRGIKYLLCAVNFFSKYAQFFSLKYKRGITIVNAFQNIISKGRKPDKIWVEFGEFYNNLLKKFLKINNIETYSRYNEGKSVVAERFMKTLKNKNFKHMTAVSKNVYFDVLDNIVNKYNNTVHRTIKMKPIDVTSDSYAEYNEDSNKKNPKFKVGDHVRISKYKSIFAKGYTPNWSEEVFTINN